MPRPTRLEVVLDRHAGDDPQPTDVQPGDEVTVVAAEVNEFGWVDRDPGIVRIARPLADDPDEPLRTVLRRHGRVAAGTLFRCFLADDGENEHQVVAAGAGFVDVASGLPVTDAEILVSTVHDSRHNDQPAVLPVPNDHFSIGGRVVLPSRLVAAAVELLERTAPGNSIASSLLHAAAVAESADLASELVKLADEIYPAKPQPWAPWESRDAELAARLRDAAAALARDPQAVRA